LALLERAGDLDGLDGILCEAPARFEPWDQLTDERSVSETLQAIGRNPAEGIPASEVAKIIVREFREGATGSVAPAAKA
jgi:hypothetical protein